MEPHFGIPYKFRTRMPFPYPVSNTTVFEEWFYDNLTAKDIVSERQLLPIFWNGYLVRANYGNDPLAVKALQEYVDGLDRRKKYFTIHQFDLGPMVDFKDLDMVCFGMSAERIDVPIPLTMMRHPWNLLQNRGILMNFIGRRTHPLRDIIFQTIPHSQTNYVTDHPHEPQNYCRVIAQSTFTLCPRGFGKSSFRIYEALQYGSIPVYISDFFIEPFNMPFEEYGIKVEGKDAHRVEEILKAIPHAEIVKKQKRGSDIYKDYYTYEGCKNQILNWLKNEVA